jgi:hypothetical protein
MTDVAIRLENVSKEYRLGVTGHGTLSNVFQSRWARLLVVSYEKVQENPYYRRYSPGDYTDRRTVKVKGRVASLHEVGTGSHPDLTDQERSVSEWDDTRDDPVGSGEEV